MDWKDIVCLGGANPICWPFMLASCAGVLVNTREDGTHDTEATYLDDKEAAIATARKKAAGYCIDKGYSNYEEVSHRSTSEEKPIMREECCREVRVPCPPRGTMAPPPGGRIRRIRQVERQRFGGCTERVSYKFSQRMATQYTVYLNFRCVK